jgi:hypothetical protein
MIQTPYVNKSDEILILTIKYIGHVILLGNDRSKEELSLDKQQLMSMLNTYGWVDEVLILVY